MKYKIYVALNDDINSGWIWLNTPNFRQRSVVCIHNPEAKKKVYCEVLQIDKNFIKIYNAKDKGRLKLKKDIPSLVINEWYRKLLGDLSTKSEHEIEISTADNLIGKMLVCIYHPQIIVRVAYWLAVISVLLGAVGIILGVISLYT